MTDLENIAIAVEIALLASLGGAIYAFHGCRPPSWIFHFRFPPSLVARYRYMSHWYGRPRKHRYICWNRVAITCGNWNNRFAVSTSDLNILLPFIQESVQRNMIEFVVSQSNKNVARLVKNTSLRSLKFDFLIIIVFFELWKTWRYFTSSGFYMI